MTKIKSMILSHTHIYMAGEGKGSSYILMWQLKYVGHQVENSKSQIETDYKSSFPYFKQTATTKFILFPCSHLVTSTERLFWLNRYDGGWRNVDV